MKRILPLFVAAALLGAGCTGSTPAPVPQPEAPAPVNDMQMPPSQPESSDQNMPMQPAPAPAPAPAPVPAPTPTPSKPPADQASTFNLTIQNFAFAPVELQVKKGDKIIVMNKDGVPHSVTSDATGLFDTGVLSPGKSFTIDTSTLKAGTYTYHCSVHSNMKGTIVVN